MPVRHGRDLGGRECGGSAAGAAERAADLSGPAGCKIALRRRPGRLYRGGGPARRGPGAARSAVGRNPPGGPPRLRGRPQDRRRPIWTTPAPSNGDARVTAPIAGVINSKTAELGEVVAPGAPIVSLYDLDHVWLRVFVPENLYGRIKIGQDVSVTVDSYPKIVFHGTVSQIASDAEFTPKNVQTEEERVKLVYGVKVNLDNRDHRLKPGMPADAILIAP